MAAAHAFRILKEELLYAYSAWLSCPCAAVARDKSLRRGYCRRVLLPLHTSTCEQNTYYRAHERADGGRHGQMNLEAMPAYLLQIIWL